MKSVVVFALLSTALGLPAQQTDKPPLQNRDLRVESRPLTGGAAGPVTVPRGFGLIIGVGKYPNLSREMQLQYSEADAEAIHDVLISKEGGNFAPEDVRRLVGADATLANIRKALEEWLPTVARENDRVVIFFAGHGFLDSDTGKGYFAPYDVDMDRLAQTAYPMDQLGRIVTGAIKSRWKVLFADACHSGAITPDMTERVNDAIAGVSRDLLAFTASRKRESSYEDKELKHGVFSYFLAQGLRGFADQDKDGRVTADELIDYVRFNVREHTSKQGVQQTPVENQDFDPELILGFNPSRLSEERTGRDGTLIVDANRDGVEFFLDGVSRGVINKDKPLRIPGVSAGNHQVQGVKTGFYPDGPREVMVYPGRETAVRLRIQIARIEKKAAVEKFEEARKLYERGRDQDLRKAVAILKQVLADSPDYGQAALYLGRAYQVLYETETALEWHKRAIEIDPDYLEARLSYAAMLLDLQNTDEVIRQARQVLSRDPSNSLAYSHLAHAYRLAEAFDQSAESARKAIELDNSNAQAHLWLAESLRQAERFDESKEEYLRFLSLTDFESKFHEKIAFYFLSTPFSGVFAKRRPTQMAVFRDQRNIAHFGVCDCELKSRNWNLATKHCRKALEYDPNDPFSYYNLGMIGTKKYNLTSDCKALVSARDSYRKLIAINPDLDESARAKQYLQQIEAILPKLNCKA